MKTAQLKLDLSSLYMYWVVQVKKGEGQEFY